MVDKNYCKKYGKKHLGKIWISETKFGPIRARPGERSQAGLDGNGKRGRRWHGGPGGVVQPQRGERPPLQPRRQHLVQVHRLRRAQGQPRGVSEIRGGFPGLQPLCGTVSFWVEFEV